MSAHVFLEGKRVYLRALERKDLSGDYFQWLNDEKVCRFNSHAVFPNTEKAAEDYLEVAQDTRSGVVLAIVSKSQDKHIGNVSLQQIDWVSRSAEFAILIGEIKSQGKGLGTEAALLIVRYGFERLNLHRIHCGTSADNVAMQKLAARLRMSKEGVRRQAMYKTGRHVDVYEYGVLRQEFLSREAGRDV